MKRVILIAAALLAGVVANAQNIWLQGAFAHEKYIQSAGPVSVNSAENGFIAGIEYDFNINNWLTVAPAFEVSGIFSNEDGTKSNYFGIDIPVLLRGTYFINNDLGVFAQAGPDLCIGLFDNVTVGNFDPVDIIGDQIKRCGAFAVVGGGVQLKNAFRVYVNYGIGLTNGSKVDNVTAKSNSLAVGVAFGF